MTTIYYRVCANTEADKRMQECLAQNTPFAEHVKRIKRMLGFGESVSIYVCGASGKIAGFGGVAKLIDCKTWKQGGSGEWYPKRIKANRDLAKDLDSVAKCGSDMFDKVMFNVGLCFSGMSIVSSGYTVMHDGVAYVLTHPEIVRQSKESGSFPRGLREVKASSFHAAMERSDAESAAK